MTAFVRFDRSSLSRLAEPKLAATVRLRFRFAPATPDTLRITVTVQHCFRNFFLQEAIILVKEIQPPMTKDFFSTHGKV